MISKITALKDVHIPILRTCDYAVLHGKGELSLHMELRLLIS
jgi:hypothetical protein